MTNSPTLAIGQAGLTVTADDKSKQVGTVNPPFSASYSGFKLNDGPGRLAASLAFATPATITSQMGSYRITPFGLTATNYTINFVDGTLTVTAPASTTNGGAVAAITSIVAPDNGSADRFEVCSAARVMAFRLRSES